MTSSSWAENETLPAGRSAGEAVRFSSCRSERRETTRRPGGLNWRPLTLRTGLATGVPCIEVVRKSARRVLPSHQVTARASRQPAAPAIQLISRELRVPTGPASRTRSRRRSPDPAGTVACQPRAAANPPRSRRLYLIPDHPPARHGQHNPRVREAVRRRGGEVAVEQHEIGAIPGFQHPASSLGKYPVG